VEYTPSLNESLVSAGIVAFGLLVFTILVRVTIPVLSGQLVSPRAGEWAARDGGTSIPAAH
jgi:Ni/Fe-hydrogenase subunit HybB-like protein